MESLKIYFLEMSCAILLLIDNHGSTQSRFYQNQFYLDQPGTYPLKMAVITECISTKPGRCGGALNRSNELDANGRGNYRNDDFSPNLLQRMTPGITGASYGPRLPSSVIFVRGCESGSSPLEQEKRNSRKIEAGI